MISPKNERLKIIALFNDSFLLTTFPPGVNYILLNVARSAHPAKHQTLAITDNFSTFLYKYQIRLIASPLLDDKDLGGRR